MWFRNLQIYRLTEDFTLSAEALHDRLLTDAFRPCGSLEPQSIGWSSPLGQEEGQLTHGANGCIMLCARREERLLPGSVVREALTEKVADIEQAEGRKVRRKEQLQLKDEIIHSLMPKAFTRSHRLYAYIDPKNRWLIADASSAKRAEELISLLRHSLGSFKVKPLEVNHAPSATFTAWLNGNLPSGFSLADECELREPLEDGGIVRCRRQDLGASEIDAHLEAGKLCVKLAVSWRERIGGLLSDDLSIKRLKFLDLVQEEADEVETDDAAARFDADFAIMNMELARFLPELFAAFGGIPQEA